MRYEEVHASNVTGARSENLCENGRQDVNDVDQKWSLWSGGELDVGMARYQ
jgi:hypothetical protein